MLGLFAALLVTIGLLVVLARGAGRLPGLGHVASRHGTLAVLDRVATGPRHGVVVLRAGERVLVVAVGDAHAALLTELDGADRAAALATARPASPAAGRPAWLARLGLAVALAVGAPAARVSAQQITAPTPTVTRPAPRAVPTVTAPTAPTAPTVDVRVGTGTGELRLSGAVGIVVLMGVLTLLPAMFMLMTGFTRIVIVLSFLRTAIGAQSAPPTQLLVAMAVILTGFVMQPTLAEANRVALQPYLRGELGQVEAYQAALVPMRAFMLANTRDRDLGTFVELSGAGAAASVEELPTTTIVSAFVTSELRTAFQMGFVLFLPFLVIDLIVASTLMSLGMFMLPPVMVSLPFKLLLFVLADGWSLVMQNLVASFRPVA